MNGRFLEHNDVDMKLYPNVYKNISKIPRYSEVDEIVIHYTVTQDCPFNCVGCINPLTAGVECLNRSDYIPPSAAEDKVERDIKGMVKLIKESGKANAVIIFYGGEPMLRLDKMNQVYKHLGTLPGASVQLKYVVVTSGHYLEKCIQHYPDLCANMWLTAISIDGTEDQHNAIRRGTSLKTIKRQIASLNRIRNGEVLIWSTLRPGMSLLDCFKSFMYFRERGQAEHFFWHWDEAKGMIPDLEWYIDTYCSELDEIMNAYVKRLRRGDLLSILHVNELILYLLTRRRRGSTACGVERMANFDIIGDGKIHACADLPESMFIGSIRESGEIVFKPDAKLQLATLVEYKADLNCELCGVEPYCGGRCPMQIHTGDLERARQYCYLMRNHVRTIKKYMGEIVDAMLLHGITLADIYYSARYAKCTDVTP